MVHRFPQRLINVGSIIVLYSQHHNFPIRHFAASPSCQSPWLPSTSECLVIRSCPIHDRPSFFFTAESGAGAFSFSTIQARYRFESASSWTLSRDGFTSHDRHRCGVTLVTLCFFLRNAMWVNDWRMGSPQAITSWGLWCIIPPPPSRVTYLTGMAFHMEFSKNHGICPIYW